MRLSRLLGATAIVLVASAGIGPAGAQSPFSVGGDGQASDLPAVASPTRQRGLAAQEAAPLSPENPATGAAPAAGTRRGPVPFDVDGDGVTPSTALPVDEPLFYPSASTTVSPLAGGRQPTEVVPVDALSADQRRELNLTLKRDADEVRELRVNVDNSQEWVDSVVDRPITPYRTLRLDGELDYRSWSVFLSGAEAARGGTLSVAFTNSVLVLPEASRLRVYLNGRQIAQTAIDSPDRTKVIALPIAADLLRPGENAFRIEADMRHRIDCSLNATYELWTRVDTRLTGFSFGGARIPVSGLADLSAIGVGTNGATRLRVIQAQPASTTNIDRMLRAVQSAALRGRYVQPLVEVVPPDAPLPAAPGILNIAIGTFDQIRRVVPNAPSAGASGPVLDLVDVPNTGPTVIITGPTERDVDAALARFDAPEAGGQPQSPIAATPPWLVQDGARVDGADTITLREAGVDTINFSGRRFRRTFTVTLPPDFYASAYGEATMLLDAAYSSDVKPGSRLSVFVNGTLSTAISFASSSGEVFNDFPISLGMQAFRPGINNIEVVAELDTDADRACLPGGTVPARDRFALFSSTRIVFPNFARIGQLPNLASFATNGFPYQLSAEPVRIRVGGTAPDTIGAAGTLVARIAVSRGATLRTNVVEQVGPFADSGVIVVAPLSDVDNQTLETTGVARVVPATWLQPVPVSRRAGAAPEGLERYDDVLRRLREQQRQDEVSQGRSAADAVPPPAASDFPIDQRNETARARDRWFTEVEDEGGVSGFFSNMVAAIREAFDMNLDLGMDDAVDPVVSDQATLIFAQGAAPEDGGTAWTLVTAPTPGLLSTSLAALSAPEVWTRIGGRITAYDLEDNSVETVPVDSVGYLATVPLSFTNLRLIAANWFSINNGVYALALILVALVLGIVTWALVRPLGRQN